jgi:hypothetical protein
MAVAVQGARAHLRFRFSDGVHASVEDCQDRGGFVGPLRRYQGHLMTTTRDDGFVALTKDVYPGSETILQSATGVHVCPLRRYQGHLERVLRDRFRQTFECLYHQGMSRTGSYPTSAR